MLRSNKCPGCAGNFEFSPEDQALKCSSCGSVKKIDATDNIAVHNYNENNVKFDNSWAKEAKHVRCSSCGANVLIDKYSLINKCAYCGSMTLVDVKSKAGVQPDAILPFQFGKEKAKEYFQKHIKNFWFVPKILKKQLPSLDIASRYVSTYIFNGKITAHYSGVLEYSETERDRDGSTSTHTYTKKVSGTMDHDIVDYVLESSTNLYQKELEEIMPFDLTKLKSYSNEFLLGSSAEYSDKSLEKANTELELEVKEDLKRRIKSKYLADRVISLDLTLNYKEKKYTYSLLPTYIFNYDYKKKHYKTLMNGQTGKLGKNVPKSTFKITLLVLSIVLIPVLIFLITFFSMK